MENKTMNMERRYRVTHETEKPFEVYDAPDGIYFNRDIAMAAFDLIVSELSSGRGRCGRFVVKVDEVTKYNDFVCNVKRFESD